MVGLVLLLLIPMFVLGGISLSLGRITPNDQFFTTSISGTPSINMTTWTLTVNGLVGSPVQLSYENITAMPSKNVTATLKCVSGPSGLAVWRGVPLSYILDLVSVSSGAKEVVSYGADGYSSSLTLAEARGENVLLAYMMNGVPLPPDQGYPLRLVVPDNQGYKWVMWITHIELVDYDYKGYWESNGYSDNAVITPYSDWVTHAYLQSVGFVFAGMALASGYRLKDKYGPWRELPSFMDRRFHLFTAAMALVILFSVFIYWDAATFLERGKLFYTSHGVISVLMVGLFVGSGITGLFLSGRKARMRRLHNGISFFAFALYAGVIFLGLIMAYGAVI